MAIFDHSQIFYSTGTIGLYSALSKTRDGLPQMSRTHEYLSHLRFYFYPFRSFHFIISIILME